MMGSAADAIESATLGDIENQVRHDILIEFVAESLAAYMAGWVHDEICSELEQFLEQVERKESPRLAIFMPPRHGKSFIASERFPAWVIGRHPGWEVSCCSYASEVASDFSRRALTMVEEPYYSNVFPEVAFDIRKRTLKHWATTEGGGYKSAGVTGQLTGSGADILIIDDPVKNWSDALSEKRRVTVWNWYTSTAYTRLAPGGGVLLIQTRWHKDDLAGRLLEEEKQGGDQWRVLSFPAIAERDEEHRKKGEALHPERYSLERLEKIRRAVGRKVWISLYQQQPADAEGHEFRRADFQYYTSPPEVSRLILSVDAAFKDVETADQVSCQVWGEALPDFYLLEDITKQMGFSSTCEAIEGLIKRFPDVRAILIEGAANGAAIIETLKRAYPGVIEVNPSGGKVARARAIAPVVESHNVWLPKHSSFADEWIEEICGFPFWKYDDRVDAFTQCLNWALRDREDENYVEVYSQGSHSRR